MLGELSFTKLKQIGNSYHLNRTTRFTPLFAIKRCLVQKTIDFAYLMAFTEEGQQRTQRSGGQYNRRNGQVFTDTFQGKLAEFGLYQYFKKRDFNLEEPETETWDLGKWDAFDLEVNEQRINVKSTKFYGNIFFLEKKDWTRNAEYIPNVSQDAAHYNFFVLTRIKPSLERLMKDNKLFYNDEITRERLETLIGNRSWKFDVPGFVTHSDVKYIIKNEFILPQNSMLNGKTQMDAENYYIQSGDMKDPLKLVRLLKHSS